MELAQSFYDITTDKGARGVDYQSIIDSNIPFTDESFPPDLASLLSSSKALRGNSTFMYFSDVTWLKPNTFFKGNYEVFIDICPSRIVQGWLGDCYFLSAVSALAERPERIKAIFVTREVNEAGCYAVQVYVSGCLQTVLLDDVIPCKRGSNVPAFTRTLGNELWVLLLEKAWAKVNENYENIEAGNSVEALSFLTGAPSITIKTDKKEHLEDNWKQILDASNKKYVMCASAGHTNNGETKDFKSVGLSCDHTYSLLSAIELIHKGRTLRLLKLRDPWGIQNWTGNWSKTSPLWSKQLKRQLNYSSTDEAIFYIEYKDYIKYFTHTIICKYHDDYYSRTFVATQKNKEYNCFAFEILKETKGFISIHQLEKRFMREKFKDYEYGFVGSILARVREDGTVAYKSENMYRSDAETVIEFSLAPGKYILYIKIEWRQDYVNQYCVNTYTSNELAMHSMEFKDESLLISQVLKAHCFGSSKSLRPVNEKCHFVRTLFKCCSEQGFAWQYFRNISVKCNTVSIHYEAEVKGMSIVYPSKVLSLTLQISPQEDEIIIFRICSNQIAYSSKISITESNPIIIKKNNFKQSILKAVSKAMSNVPTRAVTRNKLEIYRSSTTKTSVFLLSKTKTSTLYCNKQHELKHHIKDGAELVTSICFCRSMPFTDIWLCTTCNIMICPICYMRDCENYMKYTLQRVVRSKKKYRCSSCTKECTSKLDKFTCSYCNFNICIICKRMIFLTFKQ